VSDPPPSLKNMLRARASELRVPLEVIEKDYGLSHVLVAMFRNEELASSLVFKGGTALRKAYFPDYRFSVDLDFTADGGPRGQDLQAAIAQAAGEAEKTLLERGPFRVVSSRRAEREEHPAAQEAFQVQMQYPWHARPMCGVQDRDRGTPGAACENARMIVACAAMRFGLPGTRRLRIRHRPASGSHSAVGAH
jgi:hypothetical protein